MPSGVISVLPTVGIVSSIVILLGGGGGGGGGDRAGDALHVAQIAAAAGAEHVEPRQAAKERGVEFAQLMRVARVEVGCLV